MYSLSAFSSPSGGGIAMIQSEIKLMDESHDSLLSTSQKSKIEYAKSSCCVILRSHFSLDSRRTVSGVSL